MSGMSDVFASTDCDVSAVLLQSATPKEAPVQLKSASAPKAASGKSKEPVLKEIDATVSWKLIVAYRKTSSIIHTKSPNLNVSCILMQMSSLNPLKPCVKLRMKM